MIRKKLTLAAACALAIGCGTDKDDKKDGNSTESVEEFFENLEYPEREFQAKTLTHKDADDKVTATTTFSYTDAGKIEKEVRSAEVASALVALTHQQTVAYTYNAENQVETETTYSDEDMTKKQNTKTYEYVDGVLSKSTHNTLDADEKVSSSFVTEYDKYGRDIVVTNTSKSFDGESVSVETCEFAEETAFSKESCTTVYDDVKTRTRVTDQPGGTIVETTFADADDETGTVVYDAKLLEDYRFIGGTVIVKTLTKESGNSTVTESCEMDSSSEDLVGNCTEVTKDENDKKTAETIKSYFVRKKALERNGLVYDGYFARLKSVKRTDYTNEKVANVTTETYEQNDHFKTTSYTITQEAADSDENLEVVTTDVTTYTYDMDGKRILEIAKERTVGDGDILGAVKSTYTYE